MDVDAKVTIIHVIGGIIAALLSFALTTGLIVELIMRPLQY